MLDASQIVTLSDRGRRLRHIPPPCVVILDIIVLVLLGGSLLYSLGVGLSSLDKVVYSPVNAIGGNIVYLVYAML